MRTILVASLLLCLLGAQAEVSRLRAVSDLIPILVQGGAVTQMSGTATTMQIVGSNVHNFIILAIGKLVSAFLSFISSPAGLGMMLSKRSGALREATQNQIQIDDDEFLWGLEYIRSANTGNWKCLQKLSCDDPDKSLEYVRAGRLLLGAAKMAKHFGFNARSKHYEKVLKSIEEAANDGINNPSACETNYVCEKDRE